jgi:outer membrane receptor for ferrienterochelin and colicins
MVDYGRIIWSAIPVQLQEIRQIEVIKGPNSALYGFNAVGGVINIITYDPRKDPLNLLAAQGGTQSYLGGTAIGTGRIGDTAGLRLSFGGFHSRDFGPGPLAADDRAARRDPYTSLFNADGRWQVTPNVELFADVSAGNTRLSEVGPPGQFQSERLVTNSVFFGINADTPIGLVSVAAGRNEARVTLDNVSFGQPLVTGGYQTTWLLQASDLVKLGADHTLRFSLEYRNNGVASGDIARGRVSNDIYSAGVVWDWQIAPKLALTNALRLDYLQLHYSGNLLPFTGLTESQYNRTTLTELSFNSGLVWQVTDQDTLRLTAARGVQLPTLLEYAIQLPAGFAGPLAYAGRPDLRPSIVWNLELDYDRTLPAIDSVLRTAVFAQRTDDIIAWPFGAPLSVSSLGVPLFFSTNVGYSTAVGAEIGLKGRNEAGYHWNLSYALVSTTDHTTLNRGPFVASIVEYNHSAPRNVITAGVGWARNRWELDLLARWQSSYLDFRPDAQRLGLIPVDVGNYVLFDARAGYRLADNITLALTAQQFNQNRIVQTAGPLVERRIILSLTFRL